MKYFGKKNNTQFDEFQNEGFIISFKIFYLLFKFVFNCVNILIIISVKIVSLLTIVCISVAFVSLLIITN